MQKTFIAENVALGDYRIIRSSGQVYVQEYVPGGWEYTQLHNGQTLGSCVGALKDKGYGYMGQNKDWGDSCYYYRKPADPKLVTVTSGTYDMFGYTDTTRAYVDESEEVVGYWYMGKYVCSDCVEQESIPEFWADNPTPVTATQSLEAGYPACSVHGTQLAAPKPITTDELMTDSTRDELFRKAQASIERLERGGMPMEDIVSALFKSERK